MICYPKGVKKYKLWVLGVPDIKIINNRNDVFNESKIPCLKQDIDKSNKSENEKTVQSEVKLAKFDLPQP